MRCAIVDEMNGMDFGLCMQQRWSTGKILQQINAIEVEYINTSKIVEQDDYT